MSNIDANAIVDQAIADLNAMEEAIEEQGVDVPENTPTSEYDDKIRSVGGTVNNYVTDIITGETYRLYVANGKLTMEVVE